MNDGGYGDPKWWSEAGWKWRTDNSVSAPELWSNVKWNAPNKPVVGVAYWEAEAFAAWAGGRLPTEREWEAAARGNDGRRYPWGDTWRDGICNSSEANLGETTPVGMFPGSHDPDVGLVDMAGNVWEWCSDKWGSVRVIRGGSWSFVAWGCRSAYRYGYDPVYRYYGLGFRLARSSVRPDQSRAEP
jgi:formylglycine-generating enzyme required for sulfatase activity